MADARVSDIRGVDLAVRNLAANVEFYEKAWGLAEVSREAHTVRWSRSTTRPEKLLRARSGKIVDELNRSCTDFISERLAS